MEFIYCRNEIYESYQIFRERFLVFYFFFYISIFISDLGIETSSDGKYVAVIEKHDGKDYISIYHANSYILLQVNVLDII